MASRFGDRGGGLVYTSDGGRMCPQCERPEASCTCDADRAVPVTDGVVRVRRETKGRGGKAVTVIAGIPLAAGPLVELARLLKQRCGSGGTAKDGVIEIQGDHVDLVIGELKGQGFAVKRAGG